MGIAHHLLTLALVFESVEESLILLARLGIRLTEQNVNRFFHRLLESESLPGF